ncbi:DnaJ-domain-containing protein [Nadsonia fulvescens var. elongata DSM 6958]|uniref:DnaJ-domain-containing protein n=1 Tax=Nadsonia fulvescens var. elongata DSM 6958 TaxID=857566 RepID=A0A1E3PEX6_9ASCO|nr:DnaJ-domain-containing protein [Nadsonia fulvescens var. elongata DSM 6958]
MTGSIDEKTDLYAIDPYAVLDLIASPTLTIPIIKRAYRLAALRTHPDKPTGTQAEFERVALAYAVLVDPKRRDRYDRSGVISNENNTEEYESLSEFFNDVCRNAVTVDMIEDDKVLYRSSGQERIDILESYSAGKGDLDMVFESVCHVEIETDEPRVREIIQKAIDASEVKSYAKFTKESVAKRKSRQKRAHEEAGEAEAMLKEILTKSGSKFSPKTLTSTQNDDESSLAALIQSRNKNRMDSLLESLESKYAPKPREKSTKKRKISSTTVDESTMPSEEEFAKIQKKIMKRKNK